MFAMFNDDSNSYFRLFEGCKRHKQGMITELIGGAPFAVSQLDNLRSSGFPRDFDVIQPGHGTGTTRFIDDCQHSLLDKPERFFGKSSGANDFGFGFMKSLSVGIYYTFYQMRAVNCTFIG